MDTRTQNIINSNRELIIKDLHGDVFDDLFTKGVLSVEEYNDIVTQNEQEKKNEKLLEILVEKNDGLEKLMEALKEWYWWIEESLKRSLDEHKLPWESTIAHTNIPPLSNRNVSRPKLLGVVRSALKNLYNGHYVILHGMSGCGKSSLAAEALHDDILTTCFEGKVHWLNCGKEMYSEDEEHMILGLQIELNERICNEELVVSDVKTASVNILRTKLMKRFEVSEFKKGLIVLDGVHSPQVLAALNIGCKTLVTTTDLSVGGNLGNRCTNIKVDEGFTEKESLELLAKCVALPVEKLPDQALQIHLHSKATMNTTASTTSTTSTTTTSAASSAPSTSAAGTSNPPPVSGAARVIWTRHAKQEVVPTPTGEQDVVVIDNDDDDDNDSPASPNPQVDRMMEILQSDNSDGLLVAILEELECRGFIPSCTSNIRRVDEPLAPRHGPLDGPSTSVQSYTPLRPVAGPPGVRRSAPDEEATIPVADPSRLRRPAPDKKEDDFAFPPFQRRGRTPAPHRPQRPDPAAVQIRHITFHDIFRFCCMAIIRNGSVETLQDMPNPQRPDSLSHIDGVNQILSGSPPNWQDQNILPILSLWIRFIRGCLQFLNFFMARASRQEQFLYSPNIWKEFLQALLNRLACDLPLVAGFAQDFGIWWANLPPVPRNYEPREGPIPADEQICRICWDAYADCVIDPCGHVFCTVCLYTLHTCPNCQKTIVKRLQVYF